MISINEENKVVFKNDGEEYCLKDQKEYKKFVLFLTNPKAKIDKNIFAVDTQIKDEKSKSICMKYKEFFETFLHSREEVIKTAIEDVEKLIKE